MKREMYNTKDSGTVYVWALILPIVVSIILSFALSGSPKDESGQFEILKHAWFTCVLQIISALILIGIYFFYTKKNNISYKACGIAKKPNYLMVIICVVVGISMCFLTDKFITIIASVLQHIGVSLNSSINIPISSFGYYLLAVLMIAILPAITEELVYRGMILNGLRKLGKWPAILLSSLAFCLMHGNIAQFPYTFLLGIVLGYIMFETSNLLLCIIIHFFNNATVLTQMYISGDPNPSIPKITDYSAADILLAIGFFVLAVVIIILAFYLIHITKKKHAAKEIQQNISPLEEEKQKEKKVSVFAKNEKFTKPEVEDAQALQKQKGTDIVPLIVGYLFAICITIIGLI